MADYKELVDDLRSAAIVSTAWKRLTLDAADAIERLQYQLEKYHERVVYLEEKCKELPEWGITIN